MSELNAEKCGCCVRYSDLIFEAIKDAVERKIEVVELRTVVRIALEAVESSQEKLYIFNNLYKTLRKAYSNSDGDLTLTKSSKRLYNIWQKF